MEIDYVSAWLEPKMVCVARIKFSLTAFISLNLCLDSGFGSDRHEDRRWD